MTNYIPDLNRFKLSGPPQWWLRRLQDFDTSLVVVPSRQDCVYRLAQRRKPQLSEAITRDVLFKHSDTKMLASYGLIPVTTIIATANWANPMMFEELRRRAPWRQFKSTDEAIAAVEGQEASEEAGLKAQTAEHLDYLGKDAWKLYLKKIGLRGTYDLGAKHP